MNNKIKTIEVLGSGCATCKELFETTKKIVADLKLEVEVSYSDDVEKLALTGAMASPVLSVNGVAVLVGAGHSEDVIKEALTTDLEEKSCGSCSCGGGGCC